MTGAKGFLGRAIVNELLGAEAEKFEVFCLGRNKTKESEDLPNFLAADISDEKALERLSSLENIDVVVHAAGLAHQFGETPREDFQRVNVEGTKNVARLAVRLKAVHLILISSVSVYGRAAGREEKILIREDFPCRPKGFYAESKLEAEKTAAGICADNAVSLTILRPATIIGEGDRGNTARLVRMIDRGRFVWLGKGENYKSLIYKKDVARSCVSVLRKKTKETEIFNVAAEPVLMKDVVGEIARFLDKKITNIKIPKSPLKIFFRLNEQTLRIGKISRLSKTIEKWLSDDLFSGEKIAESYGFRPETPVLEALRKQVEAYQTHK